jgi:hypothetical protein
MIGGPPVFLSPGQYPTAPVSMPAWQPYSPPPGFNPPPAYNQPPALNPPRQPVAQRPAPQQQPVYRGVRPEEPAPRPAPAPVSRPSPVSIPAPEQLGVAAPGKREQLEFGAIPTRLRELGAVSCQVEQLPDGSWRFACQLATTEFGRTHGIEARAGTEAEAVRQAVQQAEEWKRRS